MLDKSKVVTIANKLTKKLGKSAAFKLAWSVVKGKTAAVEGVTAGKRQAALEHLIRYADSDITVSLKPESKAAAVAVKVTVKGKGSYFVGYLSRRAAALVRFIQKLGYTIQASVKAVIGGYMEGIRYGLRLQLSL